MKETIHAKGKLFELVHTEQPDGRVFEVARRAPGVRLIIEDDDHSILLTREYRNELGEWDYRLPGGKVFDTLDEYEAFRSEDGDILEAARHKAVAEGREEAGIDVESLEHYKTSTLGATVEWDLYVFSVLKWHKREAGQELESGEQIVNDNWFTCDQVEQMIMNNEMQEERMALTLLQWMKRSRS